MALSRKDIRSYLEDESLSIDEKVGKIAEANGASVDSLKDQIAELKRQTARMEDMQKELDTLRDQNAEDWKGKYEKEHTDFETFKETQDKKAQREAKATAYREVLKTAGVSEKRFNSILKLTDLDSLGMNKNGELKDVDKLTENIKSEWADFIVKQETAGTQVQQPPQTDPDTTTMTKEKIMAIKDRAERRKAIQNNPDLFR